MNKKAQFAMEYMILIGLLLIVLIPVIYYSIQSLNYETTSSQATDSISALAKTADTVYSLGPGNKKLVQIIIPAGKMAIGQNEILLKIKVMEGSSDVFQTTSASLVAGKIGGQQISSNLQSPTDIKGGIYNVKIEMKNSSVLIGE